MVIPIRGSTTTTSTIPTTTAIAIVLCIIIVQQLLALPLLVEAFLFHPCRNYYYCPTTTTITPSSSLSSLPTALHMIRNRGLERIVEGATPLPGGMTLYIKSGPDGTSIGDCPFAHFVRMVLFEKNLEYDVHPCNSSNKPKWLLEEYGGKMPALRHRKECYVDSDVIVQYLDFFFPQPELSIARKRISSSSSSSSSSSRRKMEDDDDEEEEDEMTSATKAVDGFFPAMAKYIKYRSHGDEEDRKRRSILEERLLALEDHLSSRSRRRRRNDDEEEKEEDNIGPYIVGNGNQFTLLDCSLAPKLYALEVCLTEVKGWTMEEIKVKYPHVRNYMDALFQRPSFQNTVEYGKETVIWGWTSDH